MTSRCIAFDLEGPLSPEDAAFDLMRLVPRGDVVFEAISRYDDLLALSNRPGYEPGDTLALIAPFLLFHKIGASHIQELADQATLVEGATDVFNEVRQRGYEMFVITSSYEPYALRVTARLGLQADRVACTRLPLDRPEAKIASADLAAVSEVEDAIVETYAQRDDTALKQLLDRFFWEELQGTSLGEAISSIQVVGGSRKMRALNSFARSVRQTDVSCWAAVGDSITDIDMLAGVRDASGLAIAFNANEYALDRATIGVASLSLASILPALSAWETNGMDGVHAFVTGAVQEPPAPEAHYHWLAGRQEISEPLKVHKSFRKAVRQAAASLG